MIKLFDEMNQGSTEITDRIRSIKSYGPYVSVSFDIRGVRLDEHGNYRLPPRRGAAETIDDFRKRMDLFARTTEAIIDPTFRIDVAGNLATRPRPGALETTASSSYQIKLATWMKRTNPFVRTEQSFDHSPGEAYANWYNLLRLSRFTGGMAEACQGAAKLEEMYRKALFDTLDYLCTRIPDKRDEFMECKRRMRTNLMEKDLTR